MAFSTTPRLLSVIIPTHNRAGLLRTSLESLTGQTLPKDQFEVVVVDDGSSDSTPDLCRKLSSRLPLRYFRLQHAGIAAAKNLGVFAATGSIVLFFDDDDVADPDLCRQHMEAHLVHSDPHVAVLGFTTWVPSLTVTPVMNYLTEIGQILFAYPPLTHGQTLNFTYFWGGRSSCKRLLLVKHGVFNQGFGRIIEDIELGYRLSKFGLKVIFNRQAKQWMNRPITHEDFCRRCEVHGASLWRFSELHHDPVVQQYCRVDGAPGQWAAFKDEVPSNMRRVAELETRLGGSTSGRRRQALEAELWQLYGSTFEAFRVKGICTAMGHLEQTPSLPVERPVQKRGPRQRRTPPRGASVRRSLARPPAGRRAIR